MRPSTLSLVALALTMLVVPRRAPAEELVYELSQGPSGPRISGPVGDAPDGEPSQASITSWVEASARAVSLYFGRFPTSARLVVTVGGPGKIGGGVTRGGRRPEVRISAGRDTGPRDLATDWVLTHEMVHLAVPDLLEGRAWLEEGIATYVEPIARVKAGTLSPDEMWRWLVWGLPKGMPSDGDPGLDLAGGWGRTYWGGAVFCFVADVQIRRATKNRRSLGDALRGILEAGGSIRSDWTIERTLRVGDEAVGVAVLAPLYARLGRARGDVDLDGLFQELGVARARGRMVYDEAAPLAAIRRSIAADDRVGLERASDGR